MRSLMLLAGTLALGLTSAAPLSDGKCSDECVSYLLHDPSGPKLIRLMKEFLKPTDTDSGPKTSLDLNGQTYEVSVRKAALVNNAIRKGVTDSVIEQILDDAGVFPSSTSPVHQKRPTQQVHTSPTRIVPSEREPIRERRPIGSQDGDLIRPKKYSIKTNPNGDINLEVAGESLRIPHDIDRLPDVIHDRQTLSEIVESLKTMGVPISLTQNRVSYRPTASTTTPYRLRVKIQKVDGKLDSVEVDINDNKFTLPGDENRLNRFLANDAEVSYQLLQIFATHKVPVEYDADNKGIRLRPDSDSLIGSRTSYPSTHGSNPSGKAYTLRIGTRTYLLPEDWNRLKLDIQDGVVPASTVQDLLDRQDIHAPGDVITTIRSKTTYTRTHLQVLRKGDGSVSFDIAGKTYDLPRDSSELSVALTEAGFPIDKIRDTLLRVGVDTRKNGNTLRIILPSGDAYLNNLPTTTLYNYKVVTRSGGVKITTDNEEFTLPLDNGRLERAIADRKVLAQNVVDAFNSVGIPANLDFTKQEMHIPLTSGTIKIPVSLGGHSGGTTEKVTLRMKSRGIAGSMVYTIISGEEEIELPSNVYTLNNRIREGKIDADLLMQLLDKMDIPHRFDSIRNYHIVTMNNKSVEINPTPAEFKNAHEGYCPVCSTERSGRFKGY